MAQFVTGVLIIQRKRLGFFLGLGFATVGATMTVFVMFVFPLWALAVLTVDMFVLFALLMRVVDVTPPPVRSGASHGAQ